MLHRYHLDVDSDRQRRGARTRQPGRTARPSRPSAPASAVRERRPMRRKQAARSGNPRPIATAARRGDSESTRVNRPTRAPRATRPTTARRSRTVTSAVCTTRPVTTPAGSVGRAERAVGHRSGSEACRAVSKKGRISARSLGAPDQARARQTPESRMTGSPRCLRWRRGTQDHCPAERLLG